MAKGTRYPAEFRGEAIRLYRTACVLEAEPSFRRVKGCKEMPILVEALHRHAGRVTPSEYDEQAA